MKPLTTLSLIFLSLSATAQEPPLRTTTDQGRIPVFTDSGKSPEISNFKAYFSYDSSTDEELRFSSGQVITLPKGNHTLTVLYENPEGSELSLRLSWTMFRKRYFPLARKRP